MFIDIPLAYPIEWMSITMTTVGNRRVRSVPVGRVEVFKNAFGLGHRYTTCVIDEDRDTALTGDTLDFVAFRMEPLYPDAFELDI